MTRNLRTTVILPIIFAAILFGLLCGFIWNIWLQPNYIANQIIKDMSTMQIDSVVNSPFGDDKIYEVYYGGKWRATLWEEKTKPFYRARTDWYVKDISGNLIANSWRTSNKTNQKMINTIHRICKSKRK